MVKSIANRILVISETIGITIGKLNPDFLTASIKQLMKDRYRALTLSKYENKIRDFSISAHVCR